MKRTRDDDAEELAGPMQGRHLDAVLQHDDEVVAPAQAQGHSASDLN